MRGPQPRPLADRFWAKVDRRGPADCWLWTAAVANGYGTIQEGGRGSPMLGAHRVAVVLSGRAIPDDMTVDHLCEVRRCVNPAHLEVVTRSENTQRWHRARAAACKRGHERSAANGYIAPDGAYHCRPCSAMRERDYRAAARRPHGAGGGH